MARIRYLKPEFFEDEDLASLPIQARLFYAGLWCYADKSGRLEDRPKRLKAVIFPYDNFDIEKILELLCKPKSTGRPFIQRYSIAGENYIQIIQWEKHQHPHNTEKESIFPPAPPLNTKDKDKDKDKDKGLTCELELSNSEITVKQPLNDRSNGNLCNILLENRESYLKAYPGINLYQETAKAEAWLISNPKNKKSNLKRYLNSWLCRAQDQINKFPPKENKTNQSPPNQSTSDLWEYCPNCKSETLKTNIQSGKCIKCSDNKISLDGVKNLISKIGG